MRQYLERLQSVESLAAGAGRVIAALGPVMPGLSWPRRKANGAIPINVTPEHVPRRARATLPSANGWWWSRK